MFLTNFLIIIQNIKIKNQLDYESAKKNLSIKFILRFY